MSRARKETRTSMRGLSRRQFTTSVGAGLLLSPFLSTLRRGRADAAAPAKQAKRVLLFCTMGTFPDLWTPTAVTPPTAAPASMPLSGSYTRTVLAPAKLVVPLRPLTKPE